jgi:lipopolysaccharide export system permease protein
MPSNTYQIFPVAILIGTIFALAQMAANSEIVVFRTSGASLGSMVWALLKIGLPLVVLSYLSGELLAPPSEQAAQVLRLRATNSGMTMSEFHTGVWVKDTSSFINVKTVQPQGTSLLDVNIYEFDNGYHLLAMTRAQHGTYEGENRWKLEQISRTRFDGQKAVADTLDSMEWRSALTPELLSVLLVKPEQMSVWSLYQYVQHLRENHQDTARYEIAMWNKLLYPFVVLVMLLLALPFASHQSRSGGISGKVFAGIVLGLFFYFSNSLFSSLGALKDWHPVMSAIAMPMLFLLLATGMLWWTERR